MSTVLQQSTSVQVCFPHADSRMKTEPLQVFHACFWLEEFLALRRQALKIVSEAYVVTSNVLKNILVYMEMQKAVISMSKQQVPLLGLSGIELYIQRDQLDSIASNTFQTILKTTYLEWQAFGVTPDVPSSATW